MTSEHIALQTAKSTKHGKGKEWLKKKKGFSLLYQK